MVEYAAVAAVAVMAIWLARRWDMSFLSRLFGAMVPSPEPKKKQRGPSRTPQERLKIQEARFLEHLQRTNPAKYEEMMYKRLGISTDQQKDELAQLQGTVKKLRELGLIKSANDIDSGAGAWIKDAVAGLGILLQAMQGQPQGQVQQTPALPIQYPPQQPLQPQPAFQPPLPVPPAPPAGEIQPEEKVQMLDPTVMFLRSQLDGKQPEEVARWLLAQQHELAQAIVAQLLQVPEGQAYGVLLSGAESQPAFRGVASWLRSKGEIWVASVARELHRLSDVRASSAPMGF